MLIFATSPRMEFVNMWRSRPSGYCGATMCMCQIGRTGRKNTGTSTSAASRISRRSSGRNDPARYFRGDMIGPFEGVLRASYPRTRRAGRRPGPPCAPPSERPARCPSASRSALRDQIVDHGDRRRVWPLHGRHRHAPRPDLDVTLHLLVQRAAEVAAIEGRDAELVRLPMHGLGLARLDL